MNLHQIVSGAIGTINPLVTATIRRSTGYTIADDGTQVPQYTTITGVPMQLQALSNDDLKQIEGLNLQGNKQAAYLNGNWNGIVRAGTEGGDLFVIASGPSAGTWLAAIVLENWPDFTKLALVQQNGA